MRFTCRKWMQFGMAMVLLLAGASVARAQYTDEQAMDDVGGPAEFAARRAELAKRLKTGVAILFARPILPEATYYREDNDFYYFTGVADPGAVLLLNCEHNQAVLFEPQQDKTGAKYIGLNLLSLPDEVRAQYGFPVVLPVSQLDVILSYGMEGKKDPEIWLRLGFPDKADGARPETGSDHAALFNHPYYAAATPLDQIPIKLLGQRYPMATLRDLTPVVDEMRNIKTPKEIEVLRRIGKISAEGDRQAIAKAHPGMYQYEIEAEASYYFASHGAQGWAYPAIVGSGADINTWHYFSNRHKIAENELVVFDFAGSLDQETMDITRTFNISGKFTPEQRKWYQVDLDAQKAVIAMLTPGHSYEEASAAGKAIYEKAGIGDQWWGQFPGHFVGLATHDVLLPKGPIKAGQVITVEPIVEFRDKRMHYRVEDTVLITEGAPEILSAAVAKEPVDVEKLVGSGQ